MLNKFGEVCSNVEGESITKDQIKVSGMRLAGDWAVFPGDVFALS